MNNVYGNCGKDIKRLLKDVEGQGADISRRKTGHILVVGGTVPVTVTASKVGFGVIRDVKAQLRRAGWTV